MKKTKILGVAALAAVLGTTAVPVLAAPAESKGTTVISYTANSASPDGADWMMSFPKKVVLTDYNVGIGKGVSLDFSVLDKLTSQPYTGARTVSVSVGDYKTTGYKMTAGEGAKGDVYMHIADHASQELAAGPTNKVVDLSQSQASGKGYAYFDELNAAAVGTFTQNVEFTFTDNAS